MDKLVILAIILLLLAKLPEPRRDLIAEGRRLDRDIVKLTSDIKRLDIMQGSTAEFIAAVDRLAEQSERGRNGR